MIGGWRWDLVEIAYFVFLGMGIEVIESLVIPDL
jgi:hypothetical protein